MQTFPCAKKYLCYAEIRCEHGSQRGLGVLHEASVGNFPRIRVDQRNEFPQLWKLCGKFAASGSSREENQTWVHIGNRLWRSRKRRN